MRRTACILLAFLAAAAPAAGHDPNNSNAYYPRPRLPFTPDDLVRVLGRPTSVGKSAWLYREARAEEPYLAVREPSQQYVLVSVDNSADGKRNRAELRKLFQSDLFTKEEGRTLLEVARPGPAHFPPGGEPVGRYRVWFRYDAKLGFLLGLTSAQARAR
jgi:hypothetical protein